MTLIVEDGTGRADAESLASVAEADAYWAARGFANWATMSSNEKEQALRRAKDHMVTYRGRYAGQRVNTTQALDWPRWGVPNRDVEGAYWPSNSVPPDVKSAWIVTAYKAAGGDLVPDLGRQTSREKVGDLEVEYQPGSRQQTKYQAVDNLLAPFLSGGGENSAKVFRT